MNAPRGRPRSFDRAAALDRALEVFWAKGYDATQVADLTAALGIRPPSFYAAFESKEALFREAVNRYLGTVGDQTIRVLEESPHLRDAVAGMFEASIEVALAAPAGGCLLILGIVHRTPGNAALCDWLASIRASNVQSIRLRLQAAVAAGEWPDAATVEPAVSFLASMLQGLSLRARDGATRQQLSDAVAMTMTLFDAMAARPRARTGARK
ncbi:TetR/AcrR family transcriptional regulator [Variovorax boronicumulans]|uniref:TetR/AcrR family transcriptional regulator n=1 Tax=Variovorax boronicumulans TaxID=436515 RepID=UPI001C59A4BC